MIATFIVIITIIIIIIIIIVLVVVVVVFNSIIINEHNTTIPNQFPVSISVPPSPLPLPPLFISSPPSPPLPRLRPPFPLQWSKFTSAPMPTTPLLWTNCWLLLLQLASSRKKYECLSAVHWCCVFVAIVIVVVKQEQ
jgi:hypothetical protein